MHKITVLTWYFPVREEPYRGHSAYQTLLRLKDFVEVEVLCPQPQYPRFFAPRSFRNSRTDLTYSVPDLPVRYVPYPVVPIISRPMNGFICSRVLEPYLLASQPDVILNYKLYPEGFAAVALGRKFNIPVVLKAIGSDLNSIADPFSRILTSWTLRHAGVVTTVSKQLQKRAIELGAPADRTKSILNGCDTTIFYPSNQKLAREQLGIAFGSLLLLFVGRLDVRKGVTELMSAFLELASERKHLQLVFVGEGPERDRLSMMAERSAARERVTFIDPCPSVRIAQWMAAANVLTLPSYAEGCPNVVIEALNCGLPVVATTVGGIPELVERNSGILVSPGNAEALAQALREALSRKWDSRLIATKAERSWTMVAREVHAACVEAHKLGPLKAENLANATPN